MKRRTVLGFVGGGAVTWAFEALAQPRSQVRRIGVFMGGLLEGDQGGEAELNAFLEELDSLSWKVGGNVQLEYRWPGIDSERIRVAARDLAESHVDVVLSRATTATVSMKREAPTIPIVFVLVVEPVRSGLVQSVGYPGGNITGFSNFEASIGGKWVELLKQMAPSAARIGLLFNPRTAPFAQAFLESAKAAGYLLGTSVNLAPIENEEAIEKVISDLSRDRGAIVGITDAFVTEHRDMIVSMAAKHRVPAIYGNRIITANGGLASYAADYPDLFRRSASYVDRILKGARPAELPVQPPSKFELSINLKTAKALGLNIPAQLVGLANEVIE